MSCLGSLKLGAIFEKCFFCGLRKRLNRFLVARSTVHDSWPTQFDCGPTRKRRTMHDKALSDRMMEEGAGAVVREKRRNLGQSAMGGGVARW